MHHCESQHTHLKSYLPPNDTKHNSTPPDMTDQIAYLKPQVGIGGGKAKHGCMEMVTLLLSTSCSSHRAHRTDVDPKHTSAAQVKAFMTETGCL